MTTQNKWFDMSRPQNADGEKSTEAEISIYDQIGGWGVTANDFIDELKTLGDVETINLRIASGGGSIVEGNTIFNALKRHSAKVVTHIDSLAASMASVIAMAGDEIRMAENALLMIHNPWTMSMGGAEQLRKDADLLDKMEANIRTSYGRSNLSAEELDAAMEAETYYTASEAKELGFIDEIDGANLAAASIGDMETLKDFNALPQGKLDSIKIECQARQIEALDSKLTDIQGDLDIANEAVENEKARATQAFVDLEKAKDAHAAELVEAKKVTDEEISARAAEQLQADGTPPIGNEPESKHSDGGASKMTRETAQEGYNALKAAHDFQSAQEFFAEHYDLLS